MNITIPKFRGRKSIVPSIPIIATPLIPKVNKVNDIVSNIFRSNLSVIKPTVILPAISPHHDNPIIVAAIVVVRPNSLNEVR